MSTDDSSNLAIRVRNLSKAYRVYARPFDRLKEMILRRRCHAVVHALQDVSFDVRHGECVGVVGHNGAGKTTLLALLTGTVAPTTGTIEVWGRVSAILGLGVGMIPQQTGRQNIRDGLITRGVEPERWEELERQIIEFSELGDAIDKPVQTYSSGMAMRLNFSIAHAVEPDILIVDEALSVGDARFVFKCQKKMREFLDKGRTLFFVSHNLSSVRELCTRALLLEQGRLTASGDVSMVLREYQLRYFNERSRDRAEAPRREEVAGAQTWGRGEVRVVSTEVHGADQGPGGLWTIAQGRDLVVDVRLHTAQEIPTPAIGVILTSGYGNRITGFSTAGSHKPLDPVQPGEFAFRYRMPTFVQPGSYRLELIIADTSGDEPTLLGIWEELLRLKVVWNDYRVQGYTDCGASIEIGGTVFSMQAERELRNRERAAHTA